MYSLFHSLLAQHSRQLTPVRCAPSTIAQLHRYFEDVVLENNLSSLVVESLPEVTERSAREIARMKNLEQTCRRIFLMLSKDDGFVNEMKSHRNDTSKAIVWNCTSGSANSERFVVIADARFSALLASVIDDSESEDAAGQLVIWTFEPDVVYSALEYLMARVTAEQPSHSALFEKTVKSSMPKATSLHLTLGVTTKLARLLQEQAEREIAVNRIAMAIRNSLELDQVLDTAAREVGRALAVEYCAVRVRDNVDDEMTKCYLRRKLESEETVQFFLNDLEGTAEEISRTLKPQIVDGDHCELSPKQVDAVVPLIFKKSFVGILAVRCEDPTRVWAENELLLLHTVADQLAVAVNQAHLFTQTQQQALTDELTGLYNRRSFELQLQRDLHFAVRMRQSVSLILIDLDKFKDINDTSGHDTGDVALRMLAEAMRSELRAVDTAARFGGDEFVIILPQADSEGAMIVAERLRQRIQQIDVSGYGKMTASFGLATFPLHASSRDTLVAAADKALYLSKFGGRNCVSIPPLPEDPATDQTSPPPIHADLDVVNHN